MLGMSLHRCLRSLLCSTSHGAGGIISMSLPSRCYLGHRRLTSKTGCALLLVVRIVRQSLGLLGRDVVLRSISLVVMPPAVSGPMGKESRPVAASLTCEEPSPVRTAPCTAAPYPSASKGLMNLFAPCRRRTLGSWMCFGIQVEPPTSSKLARSSARHLCSQAFPTRKYSIQSSSKRARVNEHELPMSSQRESSRW